MSFSMSIWSVRIGFLVALGIGCFVFERLGRMEVGPVIVMIVGLVSALFVAESWLTSRATRRFSQLLQAGDLEAAERLLNGLSEFTAGSRLRRDATDLDRAALASWRGDYAEAHRVYERLLEAPHLQPHRSLIENNLAWALMHQGVIRRAMELATKAVADGERGSCLSCACSAAHGRSDW